MRAFSQIRRISYYVTQLGFKEPAATSRQASVLLKRSIRDESKGKKSSLAYKNMTELFKAKEDSQEKKVFNDLDELHASLVNCVKSKNKNTLQRWIWIKSKRATTKGIYIHGEAGTGKTLLMDFLFDSSDVEKKVRMSFREFMLKIQHEIHQQNLINRHKNDKFDPLKTVATNIASYADLLFIDQIELNNKADALMLKRLFQNLFEYNVIVVITSNESLEELSGDNFNCENTTSFIGDLKRNCSQYTLDINLNNGDKTSQNTSYPSYLLSNDPETTPKLEALFQLYGHYFGQFVNIEDVAPRSKVIYVMGRILQIPKSLNLVADFSFDDICGQPLSTEDYMGLAAEFKVVMVRDIPKLDSCKNEERHRLLNLIEVLHNARVGLIMSSNVHSLEQLLDPMQQYDVTRRRQSKLRTTETEKRISVTYTNDSDDLTFEKHSDYSINDEIQMSKRALSQFHKMQSDKYWEECLKM